MKALRNFDEATVPFARHRGKTILDLALEDDGPSYLRWALQNTDWGNKHENLIKDALLHIAKLKLSEAPPARLTEHQHDIATDLLSNVAPGRILLLDGGAGYGKSFVTVHLANELIKQGFSVYATAVSYVATQVLAKQLNPYGVSAATLARTLRFTKVFNEGAEAYKHSVDTPREAVKLLSKNSALIIDECSMINDRDASLLMDAVHHSGGLLIAVGDSAQLPPVKQEHLSKFCSPDELDAQATLTVPMRYNAASALFQIEQTARHEPRELLDTAKRLNGCPDVHQVSDVNQLLDAFRANYARDPEALHRMLFFRRDQVCTANNAIRKWLFGPTPAPVEKDEQLMVLATTDTPHSPPGDMKRSIRYYSGQTFKVLEIAQADYSIKIGDIEMKIPHYVVRFNNDSPPVRILFGVTESRIDETTLGASEFQRAFAAAAAYAKKEDLTGRKTGSWKPFLQLRDDFLRVAYTYATTVHRTQGQTVDYAYCQPASLLSIRGLMGRALAYVACTRARKKLTVAL